MFYLLRGHPNRRAYITWIGVVIHILACMALMASAGGTEMTPDMSDRQRWVAEHVPLWVVTWVLWSLASMSLLAFFCAWASRLLELHGRRGWIRSACATCALGVACDLCGETLNIVWLTDPARPLADYAWGARAYVFFSVVTANGLYCVAGLVMSTVAWRSGFLRGPAAILGLVMWVVGLGLTAMGLLDHGPGMIVTGGLVMALFIPWAAVVGLRLRNAPVSTP